jgi:DNA-binding NarL/FixJ family response regulator
MPGRGGIKATEDIRRECPDVKVIVLTMHDDEAYVRLARLAGASGFVLKKSLATELIQAIRDAQAGRTHFPATDLPVPHNVLTHGKRLPKRGRLFWVVDS